MDSLEALVRQKVVKRPANVALDEEGGKRNSRRRRRTKGKSGTNSKLTVEMSSSNSEEEEEEEEEEEKNEDDEVEVTRASMFDNSDGEGVIPDEFDNEDEKFQMFDEDDDDEEDEEEDEEEDLHLANLEAMSARLDAQNEAEAAAAEEELKAVQHPQGERPIVLPPREEFDEEEEEEETEMGTEGDQNRAINRLRIQDKDLESIHSRMMEISRVLADFADLAEPGRSRGEYIDQLIDDISVYYGYSPFLADKLFQLFPPAEALSFFEANEVARPIIIRSNPLLTTRKVLAQNLIDRGVNLGAVPGNWCKHGLQIHESPIPIGATPEYLAGHYILQSASSFVPVLALDPQPNDRVLDMASAPGGKITYVSALMNGTGMIFANDPGKKSRIQALSSNINRLGCKNIVVTQLDGRDFPKTIGNFDRVMLDAPCSGLGVISKDETVKVNKTQQDFKLLSKLQKELILAAVDSVKSGGIVVYSTCSVTIEENEAVVAYVLQKRPSVRIVDTGVQVGSPGFTKMRGAQFHPSMAHTKRLWPHVHNMDGFFVAKLQVVSLPF